MKRKPKIFRKFDPLFTMMHGAVVAFKDGDGGTGGAGGSGNSGTGGSGGGGDGGAPKTFKWKDPNGKEYDLPDNPEVREAIGQSSAWGRKESDKKYREAVDSLNAELQKTKLDADAIKAKLTAFEEAGLSDAEKYKRQQERSKIEAAQKEEKINKEKDRYQSLFINDRINNEITRSLSKYDLNNPYQTAMLIRNMGVARLIEDAEKNEYQVVVNGKTLGLIDEVTKATIEGELSPEEAIAKFLALPENAHHLKASLRSGGGTSQTGGKKGVDGAIIYTRAQMADPKIRAEYNKKLKSGEKVSIGD